MSQYIYKTLQGLTQWFTIGIMKQWVKVGSPKRRMPYPYTHIHLKLYNPSSRLSNTSSSSHQYTYTSHNTNASSRLSNKAYGFNGAHTPWTTKPSPRGKSLNFNVEPNQPLDPRLLFPPKGEWILHTHEQSTFKTKQRDQGSSNQENAWKSLHNHNTTQGLP